MNKEILKNQSKVEESNKFLDSRCEKLYIELPKLIHGIFVETCYDLGDDKNIRLWIAEEIKNISNAQIDATLEMFKNYKPVSFEDIISAAI